MDRRAYLWVPENCHRVRGIIIGIQNMLEELILADATLREAAMAAGLAIVWITPGDAEYRKSERPAHPDGITTNNREGKPQALNFPEISSQPRHRKKINLQASTDAGLPVQFYVVSRPVQIDPNDNTVLRFFKAPPRSKFPIRVIIGAYQWGSKAEPKVQTALPVFREFLITGA